MDIHAPDVIGALSVAGDAGVAGQVLTSAGPGVQVDWATPADNTFEFSSAANTSHTIIHNLNKLYPAITVWETGDNVVVIPASIVSLDANTIEINFIIATAIAGTIVG